MDEQAFRKATAVEKLFAARCYACSQFPLAAFSDEDEAMTYLRAHWEARHDGQARPPPPDYLRVLLRYAVP